MTLDEFKAFVRGMEHGFEDGMPSLEQWKVIKAELQNIGFDERRAAKQKEAEYLQAEMEKTRLQKTQERAEKWARPPVFDPNDFGTMAIDARYTGENA